MNFPLGQLRCAPRAEPRHHAASAVSYDWRGLRYEWCPQTVLGTAASFDVERLDTPPPDLLMPADMTPADFWSAWTLAEASCKLARIPILHWIKTRPLRAPTHGVAVPLPSGDGWSFTDLWPAQNIIFTCAWHYES